MSAEETWTWPNSDVQLSQRMLQPRIRATFSCQQFPTTVMNTDDQLQVELATPRATDRATMKYAFNLARLLESFGKLLDTQRRKKTTHKWSGSEMYLQRTNISKRMKLWFSKHDNFILCISVYGKRYSPSGVARNRSLSSMDNGNKSLLYPRKATHCAIKGK